MSLTSILLFAALAAYPDKPPLRVDLEVDDGRRFSGEVLSRSDSEVVLRDAHGSDIHVPIGKVRSEHAVSDEPAPPNCVSGKNSLYFSPVTLALTFVNLEYERMLSDQLAAFGSGSLSVLGFGWGWQTGLRWYPVHASFWSIFVDLHAGEMKLSALSTYSDWGGGITGGLRLRPTEHFVISLGAGLEAVSWKRDYVEHTRGAGPRANLRASVGFAF